MGATVPSPPVAGAAAISQSALTYLPAVIALVQVAEVSGAPGQSKLEAVLKALGNNSEGVRALVNSAVAILTQTGVFRHRATAV